MKKWLTLCMAMVLCCSMVSPALAEDVTITYWYWTNSEAQTDCMNEIVAKFNAENGKGITVVAEQVPWDGGGYSNTVFTAAMGGGAPDCAAWKLTATPLFVANNLLEPLDSYVAGWDGKGDIPENIYDVMRTASPDENLYVMPWNTQILFVLYRPSIFEAKGVEVPTTYQEFLEACEKLTGDGVYGFGMRGGKGGQEPWGSFIHAYGGSFENMTSPEAIHGMQDFIDLYQKGFTPPTAPNDDAAEQAANLVSGIAAMIISHIGGYVPYKEQVNGDLGGFVFPAGEGGQWTSFGDTDNVIFADSEHKEAAFEWLKYLATGAGQQMWCEGTGNIPVSSSVQNMDYFQNDEGMRVSIEGAPYAGIIPIRDTTTDWVSTVWPTTIQQALFGDITAEEAMEILQAELWAE